LTFNVRKALIRSVLYKQLSWFDDERRAPGVLLTNFAEDITLLNGLTTESAIMILEPSCTIVVGIVVSSLFSWEITLVALAVSPLVFLGAIS
jgi:ABC-type multidrug transport system fused ATPase/permease subunit